MDTLVGSRGLWNGVCMQTIHMLPRDSWWPPFLPKAPHQLLPHKNLPTPTAISMNLQPI